VPYRRRVQANDQVQAAILIIADDEEVRDGIQGLLESDGYCALSARTLAEGIQLAARIPPDLILMTLGQAVDNMTNSARQVRLRAGLGETIPVVIFSIPGIEEGAEVEVGRAIYATRPDNFDQLRGLLVKLLGSAAAE
jgi:DNA-binding response OmpR family regulator